MYEVVIGWLVTLFVVVEKGSSRKGRFEFELEISVEVYIY
jgi:hypothetical protein